MLENCKQVLKRTVNKGAFFHIKTLMFYKRIIIYKNKKNNYSRLEQQQKKNDHNFKMIKNALNKIYKDSCFFYLHLILPSLLCTNKI